MMQRAGFGIRLAAAAIDVAALYVLNIIATAITFPLLMVSQRAAATQRVASVMGLAFVVTGCLWLSYAATELLGAASPAKRLLKLRIASAADHGPATLSQKARRSGLKYLPLLLYLVAMGVMYLVVIRSPSPPNLLFLLPYLVFMGSILAVVGGFFATLGKDRRALHDYLGGTVVLRPGEAPQGFAPIMAQPVVAAPQPSAPDDAPGAL